MLYCNPRGKPLFDIQDYGGLGLLTTTAYDGLDRLLSTVTLPEGGSTSYTYDTTVNPWANNIASVTRNPKPGSGLTAITTKYLYEPTFNKPARITGPPTAANPSGLVTTLTYDPGNGNPPSVTADAGNAPHLNATTHYSYNGRGQVASTTDPNGIVTQYTYNSLGNLTLTTADAAGLHRTTRYAYNTRGDLTSLTDPKGNVTTSSYDDARRLITATSPATAAAPNGVLTTNSYDPDGRLLQVQQANDGTVLRTTRSTWTPTGKVATTTDANGNTTRYSYDLLERLATVTDAEGRTLTYAYDALSRPTGVFNLAIQATPLVKRTYTPDGKLATLADANTNTTTFAYDGFDRLGSTTYPGRTTETATYDAADNLLTKKNRANGTVTFGYDAENRLTSAR